VFSPGTPLNLEAWFARRDEEALEQERAYQKKLLDKSFVEKGNKDEAFRYHIAKVDTEDEALREDPVLTNEDMVIGIRPEFIEIDDAGILEGEVYGAMPTGMESTVKIRVDDFLLTAVVFGSALFTIGEKIKLRFTGNNVMLFDRKSGKLMACGGLQFKE